MVTSCRLIDEAVTSPRPSSWSTRDWSPSAGTRTVIQAPSGVYGYGIVESYTMPVLGSTGTTWPDMPMLIDST